MKKATPKSSPKRNNDSTELGAQRKRIIEYLHEVGAVGMTTIQGREDLNCMMPAARVHELRWDYGFNIQLIWVEDIDAQGNKHRCGRYILFPGTWQSRVA